MNIEDFGQTSMTVLHSIWLSSSYSHWRLYELREQINHQSSFVPPAYFTLVSSIQLISDILSGKHLLSCQFIVCFVLVLGRHAPLLYVVQCAVLLLCEIYLGPNDRLFQRIQVTQEWQTHLTSLFFILNMSSWQYLQIINASYSICIHFLSVHFQTDD